MAKSKHSAALFEVIVPTKPLHQQRPPGVFRSLRSLHSLAAGWLRSRPRSGAALPVEIPQPAYEPPPPPRVCVPEPVSIPFDAPDDSPGARRWEMELRISRSTAVIIVIALCTAIGAAFIAGRRTVLGTHPLLASSSTREIQLMPPTPGVTQVLPRTAIQVGDIPGGGSAARNTPPAQQKPPPQDNVIRSRTRQKGVNYVLIQSYPLQERHMAEEARTLLMRHGIECTIEQDLWKGWYSVVGTVGFETISRNRTLDSYIARIRRISDDAHAKRKSFKAFSPMPILWK